MHHNIAVPLLSCHGDDKITKLPQLSCKNFISCFDMMFDKGSVGTMYLHVCTFLISPSINFRKGQCWLVTVCTEIHFKYVQ